MNAIELPHVIEGRGADLTEHIRRERAELRTVLRNHGALLFRGFDVAGVAGFDSAVRAFSGPPLAYTERSSPRSVISGNIYTSTDYPAQEEIFPHNENSYQASWPLTLFFYCVRPPDTRGATPLAGDGLRTRAVRDAVHRHPVTDEPVWFNHATVFHVSTLPEPVRLGLLEMCGVGGLPSNTYYGDGEPIPDDVTEHLRDCYRSASVRFDYQRDDLLVVDNMLAAHGREPFTGPRKVAVAMAEPSKGVA